MSTPLKVGIIGTGGISHAHAGGILQKPGLVEAVAICDLNAESRQKLADKLGNNPRQFDDWKKMYAEMGDGLEAVIICLPHHLHAVSILDACAARKHILCEKPMCISRDEAAKIVAAVKSSGITYMSAHNQLFLPAFVKACEVIQSGKIGRVRWIRSQDCFVLDPGMLKDQWRSATKTQGGGELIDTGYHPTYRLLHLAQSKPVAVRGTMGRFSAQLQGEDTASVQVRFENGVIGEILTSWAMPNPWGSHQIHVVGEKGQVFGSEAEVHFLASGSHQPERIPVNAGENWGSTFGEQLQHFAAAVRNKTKPIHSVEEGLATLEIILSATENADGWQKTAQLQFS